MAVVFISHSSQDKDKVEEIVSQIEEAGFDSIFLDHDEEKGIKSGEHWEQRLYSEIKRTHAMLLILSPAWIDSKWCFAEYTQAKALGKEIIPIIIDHGGNNEVDSWIDSYLQKSDLTKDNAVLQRVINRIKEISIKTQGGFKWDKHRAPYPGMMSFEEEDAAIFFGREDETIEVIEKLTAMKNKNAPKFLNMVAASGMGKSSFLKAGVLPQLKRSYSDRWIVLPALRPTKRPLYAFAKLIASFLKKEERYKEIYASLQQEDYQSFLDDITTEIEFTSPNAAILLPLDQAEELYSLANKEEKEQFIHCLTYLLEEKEHFFTVWTLRSDFLKELQSDKILKSMQKMMELYALTPLKKENVTDIIKKPATVAGIDVDERLIEKIKEDMQTTDALPLLALGLSELYLKHGKDGHLSLEEYKSLAPKEENPLEHIVKQKAEEAISAFKEEKDALNTLKEAFIPRLVGVNSKNEYIKRVALWDELPTQSHAVLEELIKARLLIKKTEDDKETVEIAHEALIRKWPLLQTWLTEEHEFLVGKSQLEIALQEYQQEKTKNDKHKAYLTGLRLQKATNWLGEYPNQLTENEKAFIKESVDFERKQSKRRKVLYASAFVLVVLFGIFAAWQWAITQQTLNKVELQKHKTERNQRFLKKLTIDNYDKKSSLKFIELFINKSNVLTKTEKIMLLRKFRSKDIKYLDKLKFLELLISEATDIRGTTFSDKHNPIWISPLFGYQKSNGDGQKGIQKKYDEFLKQGFSLVTNINEKLQKEVEKTIDYMHKYLDSDEIIVGIMDSKTGKVRSLASSMRYNPLHITQKDILTLNPKFSEYPYEAGSILKPITLAIALDNNVVSPTTWVKTGYKKFDITGGQSISDDDYFNSLQVIDVIVHSSNIGISKISWKLTGKEYREGLLKFGFGKKTGIDLPRDLVGSIKSLKYLNNKKYRANSSFGYGMTATFIQLLKAYSSFNNDGIAVTPQIVSYLEDKRNIKKDYLKRSKDKVRIISKKTAKQIQNILVEVVNRGTGKNTKIPGLIIGGKTGTAHIAKNGKYIREYHSSFYGFANDNKGHKYTIGMLVIRAKRDHAYFSSKSAVPTFRKLVINMVEQNLLILDDNVSKIHGLTIAPLDTYKIIDDNGLEERFQKALEEIKPTL